MYVECGNIGDAQKLFDEMSDKDLFSCNTMLFGYAKVGRLKLARKLSNEIPQRENFSWTAMILWYNAAPATIPNYVWARRFMDI